MSIRDFFGFSDEMQEVFQRGLAAVKEQCFQEAIPCFDEVLVKKPEDFLSYYFRGFSHHKLGETRKALSDYESALILRPDHLPTLYNRGLLYLRANDMSKAMADLSRIIELGDEEFSARALEARAEIHRCLGNEAQAAADLEAATRFKR